MNKPSTSSIPNIGRTDCTNAGGDPLVYPQIVELLGMIKDMGWKPAINTNGLALDNRLLLNNFGGFVQTVSKNNQNAA